MANNELYLMNRKDFKKSENWVSDSNGLKGMDICIHEGQMNGLLTLKTH